MESETLSAGRLGPAKDAQSDRPVALRDRPTLLEDAYRENRACVYLTCLAITRDRDLAEEFSQDTFRKAFTEMRAVAPEQVSTWLRAIARNLCFDALRYARRRPELVSLADQELGSTAREVESSSIAACDVPAVLRQLHHQHRVCLVLLYVRGYSYDEIATELGLTRKQVKSSVQNAKERFRAIYRTEALQQQQNKKTDRMEFNSCRRFD